MPGLYVVLQSEPCKNTQIKFAESAKCKRNEKKRQPCPPTL